MSPPGSGSWPCRTNWTGRRELAHAFARELVARYGVAADVAIHAPHREGDQRNWHAHVLTTTRALTREGLSDKTRVLDVKATGGPEIAHMRECWALLQNHALERAHVAERVDHRTLSVQREEAQRLGHEAQADNLDRAPEVKLGPVVSGLERREERAAEREGREYVPLTERGAHVHELRQARHLLAEVALELGRARDALAAELRQRAEQVAEQVRERTEAARSTYAHAREEGTGRISAGLAALRAAAQRQGIGQESGHEGVGHGDDREDGRARQAVRDSIRERLARLREQSGPERAHGAGAQRASATSIEEGLARLRNRGMGHGEGQGYERTVGTVRGAGPAHGQGQGLDDVRERLERLQEQNSQRETQLAHEGIRERLHEALGRARPVAQDREAHGEEHKRDTPTRRERGHDHDDGWGL